MYWFSMKIFVENAMPPSRSEKSPNITIPHQPIVPAAVLVAKQISDPIKDRINTSNPTPRILLFFVKFFIWFRCIFD